MQINNSRQSKSRSGLAGYIQEAISVSPEEVMADARAVGLAIYRIDDFRRQPPGEQAMIDRLTSGYIGQAAKWCAFSGATSGVGGVLTVVTLGVADFIHVAARLYRLSLRLAILNGLDPADPLHRERIDEIYLSSLGFDTTKQFILERFFGRSSRKPGTLSAAITYTRLIVAVGRRLWARRLVSRATSRFLPLLGSAVGAGANYYFASRAGRRMRERFREESISLAV